MLNTKKLLVATALSMSLFACKKEAQIAPTINNSNDLAVTATTSTTAAPLISSVVAATGAANQIATLAKGVVYYTDRTYALTAVPDSLVNLPMIKTVNNDKGNTSDSYLTFKLDQPSTLYVAFDSRATSLPTWLKSWKKSTATVGLNDPKVTSYWLFSKEYAAGTVTLGGATAAGAANVLNQYFVFAKAKPVVVVPPPATDITPVNPSFMLGVNGHSMGVAAYTSISADEQIALLKKMGMTCYRQDIGFNADGRISSLTNFTALYNAAKANGITILPMVYSKTLNLSATESDSYAAGKLLGTNVATKNAAYFKYYELANELDNQAIISGNGDLPENYDANKLKVIAAYLKGMDDGIKAVQPTAKTMIDASWLHTYYLQYMINYGNKFDIVAWHWYSDMESTATRIKIPDISTKLYSIFHKPIWFTEVGQRPDKVSNIEQVQSDYLTSFVKKVKQNPNVEAVLCYELFDEPLKSANENSYGMIKWTTQYSQYTLKTAAQTFSANRY